jgi:hypothetical protein
LADNRRLAIAGPGNGFAFPPPARHTGVVTADRLELISTDPWGMHGQACIAREELLPVPQSWRDDE